MQHHTDTHVGHGKLCNSGLEESSAEVAANKALGLFKETVSLIRIA